MYLEVQLTSLLPLWAAHSGFYAAKSPLSIPYSWGQNHNQRPSISTCFIIWNNLTPKCPTHKKSILSLYHLEDLIPRTCPLGTLSSWKTCVMMGCEISFLSARVWDWGSIHDCHIRCVSKTAVLKCHSCFPIYQRSCKWWTSWTWFKKQKNKWFT